MSDITNSAEENAAATEAAVAEDTGSEYSDPMPNPEADAAPANSNDTADKVEPETAPVAYSVPNDLRVLMGKMIVGLRHAPEANCGVIDEAQGYLKSH